jgi:hypothetical protein
MLPRRADSVGDTRWELMLRIEQGAIHIDDDQPIALGERNR